MLVDSSVWVEFFRTNDGAEVFLLTAALRAHRFVALTPSVLQETLQGASSLAVFRKWRRALDDVVLLLVPDPGATHVAAAELYVRCRGAGVTPRSANDCLIACSAIKFDVPILHRDQDFPRIAAVEPRLRLIERPAG